MKRKGKEKDNSAGKEKEDDDTTNEDSKSKTKESSNNTTQSAKVAESIRITLEALRMTIKETLPRINMTQSIGINSVESNILEKSSYGLSVVDKFPCFYKLVPIADNTRFLLVPQPIGGFKSAQNAVEMVGSISGTV